MQVGEEVSSRKAIAENWKWKARGTQQSPMVTRTKIWRQNQTPRNCAIGSSPKFLYQNPKSAPSVSSSCPWTGLAASQQTFHSDSGLQCYWQWWSCSNWILIFYNTEMLSRYPKKFQCWRKISPRLSGNFCIGGSSKRNATSSGTSQWKTRAELLDNLQWYIWDYRKKNWIHSI